MVAESKDRMTEVYETWTDNFRTFMDAGRRSQDSLFRAFGEAWKTQPEFEGLFARSERLTREFVPFVGKNVSTVSECVETTVRTGMDVFKAACDAATRTEETDVYRRTRGVWDAAFGAVRTNFEAFTKAGTRVAENCSEFLRSSCCQETVKAAPRTAK